MSNLFKSKFLLGVLVVVAVFAVVGFVTPSKAAADCSITTTLRLGSSGAQVVCLQTALGGLTADGNFGPKTKAAVVAWQTKEGLSADGVFGPKSNAVWVGNAGNSANFPAGCNSTVGFSATTGMPCNGASGAFPAGCSSTVGYSSTTGMLCSATSSLPAGCNSAVGFSPTTGVSCSTGNSTVVTGGAGDITLSATTSDVESSAPEGVATKVLAFKGEATGSDIAVSNVKVTLQEQGTGGSRRLDHYATEVDVWMGSTKVGSVLVSNFTKDGTTYSATIPLSGAVIRVGSANKQTFYVSVVPLTNIDTGDAGSTNNLWAATVSSIRYADGTGLTLSQGPTVAVPLTHNFVFDKITTSGDLKLTVTQGSSNPIAGNIEVSDTGSTSDILVNQFVMKPTGADMTMTALTVKTTVTEATAAAVASDMVQSLILKDNGSQVAEIDAILPAAGHNAGATTNTFTLDSDLVMTAGSTHTFAVYAKVNKIGTTGTGSPLFVQGDSLLVSYNGSTVELTSGGASFSGSISGSSVGNTQTFYSQGINASNFSVTPAQTSDSGNISRQTWTISYNLTAFGNKYYVPKTTARTGSADVASPAVIFTIVNNGTGAATTLGTASASGLSSNADTIGSAFMIPDGATKTFTFNVALTSADDASFAAHTGILTLGSYYQVQLAKLHYSLASALSGLLEYVPAPAQNFLTQAGQITI